MIQSMTAFARESATTRQGTLTVELRSVNHRYLDCSFKLPDALRSLEPRLRDKASAALSRGKLDCMIRLQSHATQGGELEIDGDRLAALLVAAGRIQAQLENPAPVSALDVLHAHRLLASRGDGRELTARELVVDGAAGQR